MYCKVCQLDKADCEFYHNNKSTCKSCVIARSKHYTQNLTPEQKDAYKRTRESKPAKKYDYSERSRQRRLDNLNTVTAKRKTESKDNPEKYLYNIAKQRAKRKGLEFTISQSDILVPTHCPIMGLELVVCNDGIADNSASLDRIDSSLGYIPGNVQVISNLANRMKSSADREQLETFARWVLGQN